MNRLPELGLTGNADKENVCAFEKIVVIMGMPRSGTSWLSQIFDSSPQVRFRLSPLFSYEFKNFLTEKSGRDEWEHVFNGAYRSDNEFMDQSDRRQKGEYPIFNKKNPDPKFLVIKDTRFHNLTEPMLALFNSLKVVAIVRHPCGAIHSWLKSKKEFPKDADPMKEWRTGACRKTGYGEFWGFDDWKKVAQLHLNLEKAIPDRFFVQRYEDLVKDPIREARRLYRFSGIEYTEQTECFLRESHAKHLEGDYAVFKNPQVADRWKKELDVKLQKAIIEEIKGTELERFIR